MEAPILLSLSDNGAGCAVIGFIFFIVVASFFGFWYSGVRGQSRMDLFTSLAGRWNGRVDPGDIFNEPRLEILVDGIPGEITFDTGGRRRSAWTKTHLNWISQRRLRVTPEGFSAWLRRTVGGADIEVGDSEFDGSFWIEASDAGWARDCLDRDIRKGLLGLRDTGTWFGQSDVTLDIGPAGLTLRISRSLVDDRGALEPFIELAILILQSAREIGTGAGIVLAAVESQGGSECPVCGTAVDKGTNCPQCGTPHHDDCWKYSGGCAIFGCAGRPRGPRAAA
jgi:hypothetical protein